MIDFSKAVLDSKYLFSIEQYNYLAPLVFEIGLLFAEHKKIYFNSIYIQALAEDGHKEAQQVSVINTWIKSIAKGGNIPGKDLFEILGVDYEQCTKRQKKIIEKFSNKAFFDTFDKYLSVSKI